MRNFQCAQLSICSMTAFFLHFFLFISITLVPTSNGIVVDYLSMACVLCDSGIQSSIKRNAGNWNVHTTVKHTLAHKHFFQHITLRHSRAKSQNLLSTLTFLSLFSLQIFILIFLFLFFCCTWKMYAVTVAATTAAAEHMCESDSVRPNFVWELRKYWFVNLKYSLSIAQYGSRESL